MLSSIRKKIRKWRVERAEKTFAQLKKENEELVHWMNEALNETSDERVTNKQRCDSEINTTRVDRYKKDAYEIM